MGRDYDEEYSPTMRAGQKRVFEDAINWCRERCIEEITAHLIAGMVATAYFAGWVESELANND